MIQVKPEQQKLPFLIILSQLLLVLGVTLISLFAFFFLGAIMASLIYDLPFDFFSHIDYSQITADEISAQKMVQFFATVGGFLLPAFIISVVVSKRPMSFMGIRQGAPFVAFFIVVLLWAAFYPLLAWTIELNHQLNLPDFLGGFEQWMQEKEATIQEITRVFLLMPNFQIFLWNVLIIAIAPAIAEEFFFRGMLQRLFHGYTRNVHIAIFITAFVFSAIHMQFLGFLPRFVLGILLGYVFYWSGSIWVPTLLHFVNNFMAVLLTYLTQRGVIDLDIEATPELPWYLILLSAVATAGLLYLLYKLLSSRTLRKAENGNEVQNEIEWRKVFVTSQPHKADIVIGLLEGHGIKGVIVNKKDSSYNFGEIEVYVPSQNEQLALEVIESHNP